MTRVLGQPHSSKCRIFRLGVWLFLLQETLPDFTSLSMMVLLQLNRHGLGHHNSKQAAIMCAQRVKGLFAARRQSKAAECAVRRRTMQAGSQARIHTVCISPGKQRWVKGSTPFEMMQKSCLSESPVAYCTHKILEGSPSIRCL